MTLSITQMQAEARSHAADPVTVEIVSNALTAIANRLSARMIRAAEALIIKEGEDCSSALFDGQGQLLAESHTVPILRNAIGTCLKTILGGYFPPDAWKPGDMVITNDPYAGGESFSTAHTNDFCIVQPVFDGERIVAFAGLMVHHLDIGSANMAGQGWNENIFQEGIRIPPLKIAEQGVLDEKLLAVIFNNTRLPDMLRNDLIAQITCTQKAVTELEALFEKYGAALMEACFASLIDSSETKTRALIARIPDGTYRNEMPILDDGAHGGPYWLRVAVEKKGTDLAFDFTGTDEQVVGPVNAPLATVWGAVLFTLRCMMDRGVATTEGCIRPVSIVAPPGTLVNARPPSAVWQRMLVCQTLIDLIMGALGEAMPSRTIADSSGVQYNYVTSGAATSGRQLFFGKNEPGGTGASHDADGASIVSPHLNNCPIPAAETYEVEFPVRYLRREFRTDSGGPGRFRGGLGQVLQFQVLAPHLLFVRSGQKYRHPAQGRLGGLPGALARWVVNEGTPDEVVIDGANGSYPLRQGDIVTVYTPGGGGFGDPKEREGWRVRQDVEKGFVSPEQAASVYGWRP